MPTPQPSQPSPPGGDRAPVRYSERLYVSWWGCLLPLAAALLLAAAVHRGYSGVPPWLPYTVGALLAAALLVQLSRTPVRISEGAGGAELQVADARVPVRFLGKVEVIERDGKRKAMGPQLDPRAYLVHRGWIGPLVRAELTDPEDPTPYWLFSTRHPRRVADLLATSGTEKG